MCRKKKKDLTAIPTGAEEKQMREQIIANIDDVMLNWSMPVLLIVDSDEAEQNEQKIKTNLQKARDILAKMILPRSDARVYAYADKISNAFQSFEYADSRLGAGSQAAIIAASEQILTLSEEWKNL